jgi:hypothetical protein
MANFLSLPWIIFYVTAIYLGAIVAPCTRLTRSFTSRDARRRFSWRQSSTSWSPLASWSWPVSGVSLRPPGPWRHLPGVRQQWAQPCNKLGPHWVTSGRLTRLYRFFIYLICLISVIYRFCNFKYWGLYFPCCRIIGLYIFLLWLVHSVGESILALS